jgi:hypothetical protein
MHEHCSPIYRDDLYIALYEISTIASSPIHTTTKTFGDIIVISSESVVDILVLFVSRLSALARQHVFV